MELRNYGFVFINPINNQFIGIDNASGGYVAFTDFLGSAHIFYNKEGAEKYKAIWTRSGTDPYNYNADKWILINLEPKPLF